VDGSKARHADAISVKSLIFVSHV